MNKITKQEQREAREDLVAIPVFLLIFVGFPLVILRFIWLVYSMGWDYASTLYNKSLDDFFVSVFTPLIPVAYFIINVLGLLLAAIIIVWLVRILAAIIAEVLDLIKTGFFTEIQRDE